MEERKRGAQLVAEILKEPRQILATILLANLFVTVFSTSLAEGMAADFFGPRGLQICILAMSVIILVFCEIVPKVIGVSRAEKIVLFAVYPLKFFMVVLAPIRLTFLKIANGLLRHVLPKQPMKEPLGVEHFKTAIQMGEQDGVIGSDEAMMLQGILGLKDKRVEELMTSREKIFAFEVNTSLSVVYEEIQRRKISRIPVYQEDLDHVVGVLYAKDLIIQEIVELRAIQIYDLLRPPYFVQSDMRADQLLRSFKSQRLHLALVLGPSQELRGLVTLEDVMESVVGRSLRAA